MIDLVSAAGSYVGTCGFRLMPHDDLAVAPATATITPQVEGHAWLLDYAWTHPEEGPQTGLLLIGTADEEGGVNAALSDTFHQKPNLGFLTGQATAGGVEVSMSYGEWGWVIGVEVSGGELRLTMHNVIPEGIVAPEGMPPVTAGPYLVMEGRLSRN